MVLTSGVGSMIIIGSLDTSLIESGFQRVKSGFEGVKGHIKGFVSDLGRMEVSTSKLVKGMSALSVIGAGAIFGLAAGAPAVAGAMAQIGIQTDRLIRTLGENFRPEFEKVAELYTSFVNYIEAHPDLTKAFVFSATALAGIGAATKLVGAIGGATAAASFLTAIAYIAGIGAVAGASYVAASTLLDKLKEFTNIEAGSSTDTGQNLLDRLVEKAKSLITGETPSYEDYYDVGSPAYDPKKIRADSLERDKLGPTVWGEAPAEENRQSILLRLIDWITFWD